MWNIYGKTYDLSNFAKYHPGGREIIEKMRGMGDLTALFETYHAFSDIYAIQKSLAKYEIANNGDDNSTLTTRVQHDFTTYRKLTAEVKTVFPDRASIKAPASWYIWNTIAISVMVFIYRQLMVIQNMYVKCGLALLFGICEMSVTFNMLHDGSHYAISIYPIVNNIFSRLLNSFVLWNHLLWLYHHVYYHHSFTGGSEDTDINLFRIRNYPISETNTVMRSITINMLYSIFPGQCFTQSLSYVISSFDQNILQSGIKIPRINYYDVVSVGIMLVKLYALWSIGLIPGVIVIVTENTLYYINIMGDHDLFETFENHYDSEDWAKRQICNSGNFMNDYFVWTMMFSGINHQIEHHLFPNMSGHQYAEITPIVKRFCKDNNLPYVHKPTFLEAYKSFMKRALLK
jgi:fatty acid desaturase